MCLKKFQVGLPKPPSTSTLPQLAELYGGGGGGPKRPLERSAAATANNGGKNPFTAMIAENAFAATTNMTNPAVQGRHSVRFPRVPQMQTRLVKTRGTPENFGYSGSGGDGKKCHYSRLSKYLDDFQHKKFLFGTKKMSL